jgi:hypothetical protein
MANTSDKFFYETVIERSSNELDDDAEMLVAVALLMHD